MRERQSDENDALANGKKIHVGRVFGIGVKKGAELPDEHPDQKYKGRYVFDGRRGYVKDEYNSTALFEELGSSPATIESSKIIDFYGLLSGNSQEDADADQAYTQALKPGLFNPRNIGQNTSISTIARLFH